MNLFLNNVKWILSWRHVVIQLHNPLGSWADLDSFALATLGQGLELGLFRVRSKRTGIESRFGISSHNLDGSSIWNCFFLRPGGEDDAWIAELICRLNHSDSPCICFEIAVTLTIVDNHIDHPIRLTESNVKVYQSERSLLNWNLCSLVENIVLKMYFQIKKIVVKRMKGK